MTSGIQNLLATVQVLQRLRSSFCILKSFRVYVFRQDIFRRNVVHASVELSEFLSTYERSHLLDLKYLFSSVVSY